METFTIGCVTLPLGQRRYNSINKNIPILAEAFLTFAGKSSFGPSYASNRPLEISLFSQCCSIVRSVSQFQSVLQNVKSCSYAFLRVIHAG